MKTPVADQAAKPLPTFKRFLPWLLVIGGTIGLICAFIIMYEKLQLFTNPAYQPGCDLNPVISCGTVMKSDQSNAFGFPNPLIGLAFFPILITVGMALFAGARFKRWFWIGLQLGTVFGLAFVHWLFFQTTYRIGALCPYCVIVWIVVITTFWYVLQYNLAAGHIKLPASVRAAGDFARRHHLDILILWFLILAGLILQHFWYYYGSFFGS